MQDIVFSVALSEAVYRLVDSGPQAAVDHANSILAELPDDIVSSIRFQCSNAGVPHRCVSQIYCCTT